jgi:alpha-L-fucosidase
VNGLLYRVSDYDNQFSIIGFKTLAPDQLEWQAQELGVLIHFNMATYVENHDACPRGLVPPASRFNPYLLSTDNWVQTMVDFGAKYAVLVAKVEVSSL